MNSPWSRDAFSGAPTEVRWTCPDCGHTGKAPLRGPQRPIPSPLVTMGVVLKPPARPRKSRTTVVQKFTLCESCEVDNMLLTRLPEMDRMIVLRHVYRLGVITRRQMIEEQIKVYLGALDDAAYLLMNERKVIISAKRVMALREELARLSGGEPR